MKFMLLQDYAPTESAAEFIGAWSPEDAAAHIEFQRQMNQRLTESGELVEAQALTGPEQAKFVVVRRGWRSGGDRRTVPGGQGAARGLPDDRCRVARAGDRDRGGGLGGARTGRRARNPHGPRSFCPMVIFVIIYIMRYI